MTSTSCRLLRLQSLIWSISLLNSLVHAYIFVTNPVSNSNLTAGDIQTVAWEDDGTSPSLSQFGASRIELVTVVDLEDLLDTLPGAIQVIAENLDVSTVGSITFRPNPNVGWNGKNFIIAFQSLSLMNPKNLSQPALGSSSLFAMHGMAADSMAGFILGGINGTETITSIPLPSLNSSPTVNSESTQSSLPFTGSGFTYSFFPSAVSTASGVAFGTNSATPASLSKLNEKQVVGITAGVVVFLIISCILVLCYLKHRGAKRHAPSQVFAESMRQTSGKLDAFLARFKGDHPVERIDTKSKDEAPATSPSSTVQGPHPEVLEAGQLPPLTLPGPLPASLDVKSSSGEARAAAEVIFSSPFSPAEDGGIQEVPRTPPHDPFASPRLSVS